MNLPNHATEDHFHQPVFILGLPRSGTSLVAGILNLCGAWLGNTVPGGGVENPKGFFENIVLREAVNKRILAAIGSDPLGVQALPYFDELPSIEKFDQLIAKYLKKEGYDFNQPWAFKEPKLTLLWPCFAEAFPQARWLIVRRPTEQIVDSCLNTSFMKRQNQDPEFWRHWAQAYLDRLEALKQSPLQWDEIWSTELIQGNTTPIRTIIDHYGLRWREEKVNAFIEPSYWHW